MKFRQKPVVIEAFRLGYDPMPRWGIIAERQGTIKVRNGYVEIETLEGIMKAYRGSYIIRGVDGELYPCRADVFKEIYETADDVMEWWING